MPFPRKLLNAGEEVVIDIRPHWLFLVPSGAAFVAALVLGIAVLMWDPSGALKTIVFVLVGLVLLLALGFFGVRYAKWATTNFVLTGDRIISRHGVLSKSGIEIPLQRVNTVFFKQSVFERMVGAGDLTIESAGERGSETFGDIRRPAEVQREIYVQMEENSNRDYRRMGQYVADAQGGAGAAGAGRSVAEELEKLDELRRRGVLDEDEFQRQKAKLLGS